MRMISLTPADIKELLEGATLERVGWPADVGIRLILSKEELQRLPPLVPVMRSPRVVGDDMVPPGKVYQLSESHGHVNGVASDFAQDAPTPKPDVFPGPDPKDLTCERCGLLCGSPRMRGQHMRRCGTKMPPREPTRLVCPSCPRSFIYRKSYDRHVASCTRPAPAAKDLPARKDMRVVIGSPEDQRLPKLSGPTGVGGPERNGVVIVSADLEDPRVGIPVKIIPRPKQE